MYYDHGHVVARRLLSPELLVGVGLGTTRSISRRRFEGLPVSLVSFRISDDECQRARQLVSVAGPPPITQEFDEFEDDDDTPTHGGDDDDALAQYEAAPSRPKSKAKRLQEEQHEGEGEGIPSSSVAAAVKPRPPPRDWSAAIEVMHAAKRRK